MKKIISLTLAAVLLLTLASCGKKDTTETAASTEAAPAESVAPTETTEPAPTEPETVPGTARAGYGELVYTTFNRGDEVTVIGQWESYYVVAGEEADLLVSKDYIRLNSEEAFVQWNGYAKYNTKAYGNVQLTGEALATLYQNKQVTVLDGNGSWLLIQWDDQTGYVDADQISRWPISSGRSDDSGSSGSSGGSSGPSGDINLDLIAYYGPEKTDLQDTGIVLADNVPGALTVTVRGDALKVISSDEENCRIYLAGYTLTAPRWLVTLEGDAPYESWTGYARWNTVIYKEYQMRTEITTLNTNHQVLVIDELEDCYVVEIDGQIGYAQLDKISRYRYSSGGGSRDSGSSGGGSSSGGGDIWTPPMT